LKWIPTERPFLIPEPVKAALQRLSSKGFTAYLVGGCVRDFLLDRKAKDYDIATDASPDQILEVFPQGLTIGKAFGVIKLPEVEIATFRKDGNYSDSRHPESVEFTGPEEDAKRRDFTVNGLFYDPKTQKILDFVEGYEDIKARQIKCIGLAPQRFQEDALRLLRAIRFTCSLGFDLEAETLRSIKNRSKLIRRISAERVRMELELMWSGPAPDRAIRFLHETELTQVLFPELTDADWVSIFKMMTKIKLMGVTRSPDFAWATLMKDLSGAPAAIVGTWMTRFKLSHEQYELIKTVLEERSKFKEVFQMREAPLQRWLRSPHFEALLEFHKAEALAHDGNLVYYEFCRGRLDEIKAEGAGGVDKFLTGNDLIQLGFSPGPRFTQILNALEDQVLEKKIKSREEALEFVIKHFEG